ncbi:MAG: tetratricopeptide repeat protein [Flavobacteriaceae bacterium]
MRIKNTVLFLALLFVVFQGFSQGTEIYTHPQKKYQDALELYHNKQYQAAQAIFNEVAIETGDYETRANSAYYAANAAIRLNQVGADGLMEAFVTEYPTSTKRNSAFLDVADYYFENGRYPYALKWYKKVDQSSVTQNERERFNFNMGYSLFASKKTEEAKRYLKKVSSSGTYGSQAKYYLGYIAYQQDDYEGANERFDQITNQEGLSDKLSYYQADMNFKLGNFEEAIALAQKQLPRSDRREVSELNKIIGESYFNLAKYAEAIPYLEAYKGKRGKWSNTDFYLLGYCYYKQEDFANAIQQFNKIIGGANSVSQNAYYHLAECYLKLDKKQEALNAFRNASQMEFSKDITQDAALNYARLSYEIGNAYEPVPQVLKFYLEQYPGDQYQQEIQELLVDSYITSKNFEGALELLEENRGYASKATFQKVAFYRGLELFLDNDFDGSITNLEKSLASAEDQLYKARALYWKADAQYRLNRFEDALNDFRAFGQMSIARNTKEFSDLEYNLGYTYFKLKDYNKAAESFKAFERADALPEKKNDASMRLGDSYFVTGRYQPAINAYNRVVENRGAKRDYATFQMAMSQGFIGNTSVKIEELKSFVSRYPNSKLQDDALFELGTTYVRSEQQNDGLSMFDKLIATYPKSKFVPQALMRQGLVYYSANRNEEALSKLKTVARDFPDSQEAIQAVSTAKLIYVDLGRVDEYADWVKNLDFVEVSDAELDQATYESADKKYQQGNTTAALKGFQSYIKEFPNGIHSLEANFRLAQLLFAKGDTDEALTYFKNVSDRGNHEYSEQALTRICEIYVSSDRYDEAFPYLLSLEEMADIQQNITFARSNLMKAYYQKNDDRQTIVYAEKVLSTADIDDRIKSDAQLMIARSAIRTNDEDKAEMAYAEVLKIAQGRLAAEALYYEAYFKNKRSAFEDSNASVQKLVKDYAAYKEWGAKGLILMAKNFYALDDAFQSTYILESVISNFSDFPEIVKEADSELSIIKAKEAQRNSDVQPNQN